LIKILLIGRSFKLSGGVTTYLQLLTSNQNQKKIQIKFFVQGKSPIKWKNIFYPMIIITQLIKLNKLLKTYQPDIVHLNPSLVWWAIIRDFFFLNIIKSNGYPVLLFIHGWGENLNQKLEKKGICRIYLQKNLRRADGIVVLAEQFKKKLVCLGLESRKIYVSSTMVDSNKYRPKNKEFLKPYTILFCGNIIKEKGPFELLDSIPMIVDKYADTKFIFMGSGEDLNKLRKKVKEKQLGKNIIFTGYITGEEKIDYFKQAHIFVLPSYSEGFPLVVLEAMAAGLPLIITPVGGLLESIEDGKQGLIISTKIPDSKEIAEKILYLIENPVLMKKMSENNIREAKEKYDVKIVTGKIFETYNHILTEN